MFKYFFYFKDDILRHSLKTWINLSAILAWHWWGQWNIGWNCIPNLSAKQFWIVQRWTFSVSSKENKKNIILSIRCVPSLTRYVMLCVNMINIINYPRPVITMIDNLLLWHKKEVKRMSAGLSIYSWQYRSNIHR